MAEVSLSAYQDKLEELLRDSRYDEVIAHSRHILKLFPKNLRAYKQLAGALYATGRWDEAASVLRRVMGAEPSDFETHSLLALCYQQLGQADRAIWHAERALDQKPSDSTTTKLIRDLYREHRSEQIERLQLTAGALAQQQIRNNLLHVALDTLAQALERHPERIDLQLLRARTLWLDGQRMDAAEAAVDILERLPYAVDANRILTELWLAEKRPSDAQLYLRRIEELDPYLAHQLAAGERPAENLRTLEELDYNSISQREQAIVNPEWLDSLSESRDVDAEADESGGLGALFGINEGETDAADTDVTADLDDLLTDDQIEALFSELVTGEPVAAVSALQKDDVAALKSLDEKGLLAGSSGPASAEDIDAQLLDNSVDDDVADLAAQFTVADADDLDDGDLRAGLDDQLANILEELDSADEEGDWMAEIQTGSLTDGDNSDSLEYSEDFDREWLRERDNESGAPWLSAAIREAIDEEEDGDFDIFADDEQLQNLLNRTSDTEPIHQTDIEDWLGTADESRADEQGRNLVDLDDEDLLSPPAASWLDDGDEAHAPSLFDTESDADPNQLNLDLIDSWQTELGDDEDDDDPYVDWLSDDPDALDSEISALSAPEGETDAAPGDAGSAVQTARAWGLEDPDQLADFVEEAAETAGGSPDWMNAIVPGLDRANDAATDDPDEYARPMGARGKEFAWVNDIVDEETGEMKALDPAEIGETPYFRFSNPPAWLTVLQTESVPGAVVAGVAALSLDENFEALDLDGLTFDDYFNFDTPTDKMDVINLDEDTERLNFVGIDWDDYFDLESPTEKTIAITLDEDAAVKFDELGLDDDDFDFETSTDQMPAVSLDTDGDPFNFDDIGLGDAGGGGESLANDKPAWLDYDDLREDFESDDRDRDSGQSTV